MNRDKTRRTIKNITLSPRSLPRSNSVTVQIGSSVRILTARDTLKGTRDYQQDALFVADSVHIGRGESVKVFGVLCDGMGGMQSGGEASLLAVEEMRRELEALSSDQNIAAFLVEKIQKLDAIMAGRFGDGTSGTTLVAAVIFGSKLYLGSVGDSRVYLLRRGEIVQVTRDHNYHLQLQEDVEKGKITQAEADTHPKREALISFIGSGHVDLIDANTEPFLLAGGDIVLLCSDGLTKSLSDEEIGKIVFTHADNLNQTARLLTHTAIDIDMGPKDNTSVILMQYLER